MRSTARKLARPCRSTRCDTVARSSRVPPPALHRPRLASAPDDLDPPGALERLRDAGAPWLLESALPLRGSGRYSFAGADPYLILRARGLDVEIECRRAVYEGLTVGTSHERGPALAALRARLPAAPPERVRAAVLRRRRRRVRLRARRAARRARAARRRRPGAARRGVAVRRRARSASTTSAAARRSLGLGFAHDAATARARAERAAHSLAQRLSRPAARRAARARRRCARERARRARRRRLPQGRRGDRRRDRRGRALPGVPHLSHRPRVRGRSVAALPRAAPPRSRRRSPPISSCPRSRSRAARPSASCASTPPRRVESRPIKGTATRGGDPAQRRARGARARGLREGPRREPDDRRPRAQRPRARVRAGQHRGAGAVRGRAVRLGVPARVDRRRAGCAPGATRSTRSRPRSRPAR